VHPPVDFLADWEAAHPSAKEYEPDWIEPWVGAFWLRMDRAALGPPYAPIDPDTLSVLQRSILPEWEADWTRRRKEAEAKAKREQAEARRLKKKADV